MHAGDTDETRPCLSECSVLMEFLRLTLWLLEDRISRGLQDTLMRNRLTNKASNEETSVAGPGPGGGGLYP